ncbi:MAG: hypothetical protein QXH92_04595 [Candidatus Aenigmatarchaeota archaeon]
MARVYVGKSNYTYNNKPLYRLTIYDYDDANLLIPFIEFELHIVKEDELWIVGYVENLSDYKGVEEFNGTGYCYLPIHLTEKYKLGRNERSQDIFEKLFCLLAKEGILLAGNVYQHNLKIGATSGMEYLEKLFKSNNSEVTEIIFKEFFGTEELKILKPGEILYMGSEIKEIKSEVSYGNNGKRNGFFPEKKLLNFIHDFLKEYREDLIRESLGEQLRTIYLEQSESKEIILSAIDIYLKLIGGTK